MKDKTVELLRANSDVLALLKLVKEIGWNSIREQTIQRILYISKVLYGFVYPEGTHLFDNYHFSITVSGPYSELILRSIIDLKTRESISDVDGEIELVNEIIDPEFNKNHEEWLKTVVYILGVYGESKIFNFTIRDPLYEEAIKTNSQEELDTSPENKTIKVLNAFKETFEETLKDTSSINKKEYLELYFEYIFSKIIKREE